MSFDIVDQLAVVAQQGDYEFRTLLMYVCLYALAAAGAFALAWAIWTGCKSYVEKVGRGTRVGTVFSLAFLGLFVSFGGSKHLWRFTFQNGVTDAGSYCTNDIIHAEWTYLEAYAGYALKAAYRDLTITNDVGGCIDDWHYLEDAVVADTLAEWYVPDATNMEIVCYAQYVQPVHVVTNGVYHVGGVMRTMATTNMPDRADYVTPGVTVRAYDDETGDVIMTPTNEPPESVLGLLLNETNNNDNQEE